MSLKGHHLHSPSYLLNNAHLLSGAEAESPEPYCPGLAGTVGGGAEEPLTYWHPASGAGEGEGRAQQPGEC